MKKTLKYISIALISSVLLTSCDEDGFDNDTTDIGGYTYLEDTNISVLDRNSDLNFSIITAEGVSAEEVEIIMDGSSIATGNINGETGTFNTSAFGDFSFEDDAETGNYNIVIRTTYSNGNYSEDPFTISVDKVTSLSGNNPSSTSIDSLSSRTIAYSNFALSEIDKLSLSLSKNSEDNYIDSEIDDLDLEEGTFTIGETNYTDLNLSVNDTLNYKITSEIGDFSDETTGSLIITPKSFTSSFSANLSNDASSNQLDLSTGEILSETNENGEIKFLSPNGFEVTNDTDLSFVKVDANSFGNVDVLATKELFENGDTSTSLSNLKKGDTFVYKVDREDEGIMYGILQVTEITVVNGTSTTISLNYSEGK